jgi:23S rRNA maturation mini-RNase III
MTQDDQPSNVADVYKHITEAENQAASLEKMLDQLDAKIDSILKEAQSITKDEDARESIEESK